MFHDPCAQIPHAPMALCLCRVLAGLALHDDLGAAVDACCGVERPQAYTSTIAALAPGGAVPNPSLTTFLGPLDAAIGARPCKAGGETDLPSTAHLAVCAALSKALSKVPSHSAAVDPWSEGEREEEEVEEWLGKVGWGGGEGGMLRRLGGNRGKRGKEGERERAG